jgi:hypothetical protein
MKVRLRVTHVNNPMNKKQLIYNYSPFSQFSNVNGNFDFNFKFSSLQLYSDYLWTFISLWSYIPPKEITYFFYKKNSVIYIYVFKCRERSINAHVIMNWNTEQYKPLSQQYCYSWNDNEPYSIRLTRHRTVYKRLNDDDTNGSFGKMSCYAAVAIKGKSWGGWFGIRDSNVFHKINQIKQVGRLRFQSVNKNKNNNRLIIIQK